MLAAALQPRVDEALVSGNASSLGPLNQLVIDLAGVRETEALIRVWDAMGGSKGAEERTWQAVEGLHSLGKDKIPRGTLALPVLHKRTLEPARRLHKICKGRRLSQRSDQALTVFEPAVKWVETQRAMGAASPHASYLNGQGAARHKLAQVLAAALCVPKETARGVVTKLKQRKKLG